MEIRQTTVSVVLGILLASLIAIQLVTPATDQLYGTALLLMILGLLLALYGLITPENRGWTSISISAIVTAAVSTFAAYQVGLQNFGGVGAAILGILWALLLIYGLSWMIRNTLSVPTDRAIVVTNVLTGNDRLATPPRLAPLIPMLEQKIAEIPLYELFTDVMVEKLNTRGKSSVDKVNLRIHYKVADPLVMMNGIPNHDQTLASVAKSSGIDARAAENSTTFWEKVLTEQMKIESEDILRRVVFNDFDSPASVYKERNQLELMIKDQLSVYVARWGVKIRNLELDRVEVPAGSFDDPAKKREAEDASRKAEAEREALRTRLIMQALAETEADRVRRLLEALKSVGINPSDRPDLVMGALRNSELILEGEFTPLSVTEKKDAK